MPWDPASGAAPAATGGWASAPTEQWDAKATPTEPLPWDRDEPAAPAPEPELALPSFSPTDGAASRMSSGRVAAPPAEVPAAAGEVPWDPKKSGSHALSAAAKTGTTSRGKAIPWEERPPPPPAQRVVVGHSPAPLRDGEERVVDEAAALGVVRTQSGLGRVPPAATRAEPPPRRTGLWVGLAIVMGALAALGLWVVTQRLRTPTEPPTLAIKEPDAPAKPPLVAVDAGVASPVATAPDAGSVAVAELPDAGVAAELPDAGVAAAELPDAGVAAELPDAGVAAAVAPTKSPPVPKKPPDPPPGKPKVGTTKPERRPDEPPRADDRRSRLVSRRAKLEIEYEAFVKQWGTAKVGSFVNSAHDRVASSFQRWIDSPDRHDELDRQLDDLRNALQERKQQLEKR